MRKLAVVVSIYENWNRYLKNVKDVKPTCLILSIMNK